MLVTYHILPIDDILTERDERTREEVEKEIIEKLKKK